MRPLLAKTVSALTIALGCSRRSAPVPIRVEPAIDSTTVDVAPEAAPAVKAPARLTASARAEKPEDYLGYAKEQITMTFTATSSATLVVEVSDRGAAVASTRRAIGTTATELSLQFVIFPMESGIDPPGSTGFIRFNDTMMPRRFMHGYPSPIGAGPNLSPDPSLARTASINKKPVQCERDDWCELATWVFHKKGAPPDAGASNPIWTLRAKLE